MLNLGFTNERANIPHPFELTLKAVLKSRLDEGDLALLMKLPQEQLMGLSKLVSVYERQIYETSNDKEKEQLREKLAEEIKQAAEKLHPFST